MGWGVALCPSCRDVLVSTFAWPGYEFVCLSCGNLWRFMQPKAGKETPENLALIDQREAEWQELSAGHVPATAYLKDCADEGGGCPAEHHIRHATAEELAASEAARARIGERLGREAP